MAGTAQVAVTPGAYVSLGTGPMLISPQSDGIMIVAASSQPAASAIGHPLKFLTVPFFFPLTDPVWAISLVENTNVTVTT